MPLFSKTPNANPPTYVIHRNEASELRDTTAADTAEIARLREENKKLALAAKNGDADAGAQRRANLERIAILLDAIDQNRDAAAECNRLAAEALSRQQAQERRAQAKRTAKRLGELNGAAKDIREGASRMAQGLYEWQRIVDDVARHWPGGISPDIAARCLLHPAAVEQLCRQEMYHYSRPGKQLMPGAYPSMLPAEYPGVVTMVRNACAYARGILLGEPVPQVPIALPPAPTAAIEPMPVIEPGTVAMHLPAPPQSAAQALGLNFDVFSGGE